MNKRIAGIVILFLLLQLSVTVSAQHYFGTWEGTNEYSFGWVKPQKVVLELYKENDSTIYGASHLYYTGNKYEHYTVKGTINTHDQTVEISEVSELSIKLGFLETNASGTYFLKLTCSDTLCSLTGKWKAKKPVLFASRTVATSFSKIIEKTPPQVPVQNTTVVETQKHPGLQRKPDIQSLIEIDSNKNDSININIYDNGDIDQDSVSLYLDDSLLLYKRMITDKPLTVNIPVSKIQSISKLTLVAESLGTIPPCTAIMIIYIGKKRYEVRNLSSDFDKNGVVEFFLK